MVHFRENYESGGVPSFNFDRAATVASIERMKQIAANLKATVVTPLLREGAAIGAIAIRRIKVQPFATSTRCFAPAVELQVLTGETLRAVRPIAGPACGRIRTFGGSAH